jgi:O-methyltransferase
MLVRGASRPSTRSRPLARNAYLELLKRVLTNSIYLGTDSAVHDPRYYSDTQWHLPRACVPHSLCKGAQLDFLETLMSHLLDTGVRGDFLEAGVWRGGSAIFMAAFLRMNKSGRRVWAVDSFAGIPRYGGPRDRADPVDDWPDRWVAGIDEVREHFARYGLLDHRVRFVKGMLSNTLRRAPFQRLALARLDVDSYASYRDALQLLYPRMSKGGCIIFDDWHLESCRSAVADFRRHYRVRERVRCSFRGRRVDAHLFVHKD